MKLLKKCFNDDSKPILLSQAEDWYDVGGCSESQMAQVNLDVHTLSVPSSNALDISLGDKIPQ